MIDFIRRFKNVLRIVKKPFDCIQGIILRKKREPYIGALKKVISPTTSIISSNCFAGRIMQDLGMEYNSPTLGLYFNGQDYPEFLSRLRFYLEEAEITFVEHSKFQEGDERRAKWKHWYPIGLLDGKVEVHFLHYHTEQEASEKWHRRASRVNYDNLLIIGMEQNWSREEDIVAFDALPYKHKFFFTVKSYDLSSVIPVSEFGQRMSVGDPYKEGHIFYKYLVERLYFAN